MHWFLSRSSNFIFNHKYYTRLLTPKLLYWQRWQIWEYYGVFVLQCVLRLFCPILESKEFPRGMSLRISNIIEYQKVTMIQVHFWFSHSRQLNLSSYLFISGSIHNLIDYLQYLTKLRFVPCDITEICGV